MSSLSLNTNVSHFIYLQCLAFAVGVFYFFLFLSRACRVMRFPSPVRRSVQYRNLRCLGIRSVLLLPSLTEISLMIMLLLPTPMNRGFCERPITLIAAAPVLVKDIYRDPFPFLEFVTAEIERLCRSALPSWQFWV